MVLLILAGVSIAMLTGDNGILTQAQEAKTRTENATANEAGILSDYETKINEALGIKPEAEPGHYYETNTEVQIAGKELTIPGGSSLSKIEGEYEDIEQGIVIYITNKQITDEEWQDTEKMQTTYDQFVWIPVKNEEKYVRNLTYPYRQYSESAYTDTGYLPEGIQPETDDSKSNELAEREAVMSKYGFYISRYEAGYNDLSELVSRKKATLYTNIHQLDCKVKAKNFKVVNNENVKSALCSGIQWDMTMIFVDKKTDGTNENIFDILNSSQTRHIGTEVAKAGQNESDRVCNIYDLEGNCSEYVAEKNDGSSAFIIRGGNYNSGNAAAPASIRKVNIGTGGTAVSFRFVLYAI